MFCCRERLGETSDGGAASDRPCVRHRRGLRGRGFAECLSEHRITPATLDGPAQHADDLWEEEQATLADWLEGQPKPLAVLAANDNRAWHVLCAARARKLGVPEEVAVLG